MLVDCDVVPSCFFVRLVVVVVVVVDEYRKSTRYSVFGIPTTFIFRTDAKSRVDPPAVIVVVGGGGGGTKKILFIKKVISSIPSYSLFGGSR